MKVSNYRKKSFGAGFKIGSFSKSFITSNVKNILAGIFLSKIWQQAKVLTINKYFEAPGRVRFNKNTKVIPLRVIAELEMFVFH